MTTRRVARGFAMLALGLGLLTQPLALLDAAAQAIDCGRLAAQIAALGRGGNSGSGQYAAAAQKQRAELARTSAYANSIGCSKPDFFLFGDRPAQCASINAQIARMQANMQGLSQAAYGGDNGRAALQQRYDAYCRGSEPGSARGIFERLFGGGRSLDEQQPDILLPSEEDAQQPGPRGGSQAVCVRTCDGGFFPLSIGARQRGAADLQDLCSALCPGVETKLYTRAPGREISTAVSLGGDAYADLPNALKFEKSFDKTCTCKPAGKSWAEVLASAETLLGDERRGDIMVTPEKAEELSRVAGPAGIKANGRKFDPRAIAKTIAPVSGADAALPPAETKPTATGATGGRIDAPRAESVPADGAAKPGVRVIPR